MRSQNAIDEQTKARMRAFEEGLYHAANSKKMADPSYPNLRFKPGEYCMISKEDVLNKYADAADTRLPYYDLKVHVSLELKDGDHNRIWNEVLLELFKNPCVFGTKVISPYATIDGRQTQPGKEVTIYFLRPEDMNPPLCLPSAKAEHLKVIKQLDEMLQKIGIKPSVPPTNAGVAEYNAMEVCNNPDNSRKGMEIKTSAIYISPPDQDAQGAYIKSAKREHKKHTYTQDVLDHYRRNDPRYVKLDILISIMPTLVEILNTQPGNNEFFSLLETIRATSRNEETSACLDTIKALADYCARPTEEPKQKTGFFSKKSAPKDTRLQDVSLVIASISDKTISLIDFKSDLNKALRVEVAPAIKPTGMNSNN